MCWVSDEVARSLAIKTAEAKRERKEGASGGIVDERDWRERGGTLAVGREAAAGRPPRGKGKDGWDGCARPTQPR